MKWVENSPVSDIGIVSVVVSAFLFYFLILEHIVSIVKKCYLIACVVGAFKHGSILCLSSK